MIRKTCWLVLVFVASFLAAQFAVAQCGPGGCPGGNNGAQGVKKPSNPGGTFNFRYERPEGKFDAAVRIQCSDGNRVNSLGSGVVVRWGSRVVVVTARHVIVDAKGIVVVIKGVRKLSAKVLAVSDWDCAVLQTEEEITDLVPAEMANSEDLSYIRNEELTSAGYGDPTNKFAINVGHFVSFMESDKVKDGCSDWIVISGPARPGDSGGPIYTKSGKVAGILWGTDNVTVVGVYAGRVGLTLNDAMRNYQQRSYYQISDAVLLAPLVPVVNWQASGKQSEMPTPQGGGDYVLPYRNEQAGREQATAEVARALLEATKRNSDMLAEILRIQKEKPNVVVPPVAPISPPVIEEPSLRDRIGDKIEARKDAIADGIDAIISSDFARRALIVCIILGVIWWAINRHRKAGTPTHIERATEAIKIATAGIPVVGQATAFVDKISDATGDKIRDLQEKLAAKHAEIEAKKAELASQKELTKVALATPAPAQVAPKPSLG
jgi:hypothetical protein